MEENEENPVLLACLPLSSSFSKFKKIVLTSGDFTLGRSLSNSVCIPMGMISRKHCTFKKTGENEWYIEDHSLAGIRINNEELGKGSRKKLEHEDMIALEPSDELQYKFILPSFDVFETPRKRMKMSATQDSTIINNVKIKFEESQKCEIQHIEDKIQNAKKIQSTSMILKNQLQEDMNRKIKQLEHEFSVQIENLKGEKNEVEQQKASLIEERNAQLTNVKVEMEGKITELMEQIRKHDENESELLKENSLLKEKLSKEREDFLSELNRESSSKQDMLDKLEAKIREQEDVRLKERQELENALRQETELLRLAKEKELKEMAELKLQRETELQQELTNIKQNLADQVEQTKQQRIKAEQELKLQIEQMFKLQADEKVKMDQFLKEREEIQKKLTEARIDAEKSKEEVQARVIERETELAALAAERIQKQVDQSSEVISTLQMQLEKVKSDLQSVETEKNTLLENICMDPAGEGTSKQETLNEFGELMESELQCSVCAELFVEATTLNCSHTFCKYCIAMWKKKKKDCPICRSPITSECRSLVLDSFIEKMVQNLTDEMKTKRQDMLKFRAAEVECSSRTTARATTTTSRRRRTTTANTARRGTTRRTTTISGPVTTMTASPIVDLTMLPIPMSPTVRPPVVPAQMTLMQHPQQSRQIEIENLTTPHQVHTVDLTQSPISRETSNSTTIHRMLEMLETSLHPHQGRQNQTENQATGLVQTLDLTRLPISQIPTGDRQMSIVPTNTRQMATDLPEARQVQTEHLATRRQTRTATILVPTGNRQTSTDTRQTLALPTGVRQIPTVAGPTPPMPMNLTERLIVMPLNPAQQGRQNKAENPAMGLVQTVDLTRLPISQMSTLPTNTRQMATDPNKARHTLTGNQVTSHQMRPATAQMPVGNRQMSTDTHQNVTYLTGDPQISIVAGPMPPTSTNPTEGPIVMPLHPAQQGGQIEVENLTTPTLPQVQIMAPTTSPQISQIPTTEVRQTTTNGQIPMRRLTRRAVVPAPEGGVTFLASRAPTTAGMGAASHVVPEAIGLPAAPSDNQNRPS